MPLVEGMSGSGNGMVSSAPRRALRMSQSPTTSMSIKQPWTTATFIYGGDPGVAVAPRSPQQTEEAVYRAFVRQSCFAKAPGPTVGASISVGGGGAGGRNGQSWT